jgi:anti-sigma factor RsiW
MNHSDVQSRMADYLDGELGLDERALVDAHLDGCGNCSTDLSELHGTVALLRALPTPEPPSDLAENVIARLRAGEGVTAWQGFVDTLAAWLTPPRLIVPATALAAAAGVLLVGEGQIGTLFTPDAPLAAKPVQLAQQVRPAVPGPAPSAIVQRAPVVTVAKATAAEPNSFAGAAEPEPLLTHAPPPTVVASKGAFRSSTFGSPQPLRVAAGGSGGARSLQGATAVPQAQRVESSVGRERLLADRLEILRRDPAQFAAWIGSRSRAERDLWLTEFARFASERKIGPAVLQALRGSSDPRLESAALKFESVLDESDGAAEVSPQR